MSYQDQVDRSYLKQNGWIENLGGWRPEGDSGLIFPISTKQALGVMAELEKEKDREKEQEKVKLQDIREAGL